MGFLTSLFGGPDNPIITVLLALAIVLILIVLGVWGLKALFNATGNVSRGRNKRLTVLDSTPIDQRRQLVLVRRDNVEHLIMVGGAQELVIETGIEATETPAPSAPPRTARRATGQTRAEPRAPATAASLTPDHEEREPRAPFRATNAAEQLGDLGRPVTERRSSSLRHTGLLRPVSRMEPVIPMQDDKPAPEDGDSDKNAPEAAVMNGSETSHDEPQAAESSSEGDNDKHEGEKSGQSG